MNWNGDSEHMMEFEENRDMVRKHLDVLQKESDENSGPMCYYTREGHYMNLATIEEF